MQNYQKLEAKMARVQSLRDAGQMLNWDANVLMPKDAATYRSDQLAAIEESALGIIKENDNIELVELAKKEDLSAVQKANLHEIEFVINSVNAVNTSLLVEHERARLNTEVLWREAKAQDNFKLVQTQLTQLFNLTVKIAQTKATKFGFSPYQVMINEMDHGLEEKQLDKIFNRVLTDIPPLLSKVRQKQHGKQDFSMSKGDQIKLAGELSKVFGFKGRIDESMHPFCGGNPYDGRITTFYFENDLVQSVMAIIHESGHALYEQNLPRELIHQPVGRARGAMHESQSLFMEKQVGASPEFISWLVEFIRQQLPNYNFKAEHLNEEINTVSPSFIRVFADELTYPLHVAIRYFIEKKLVNGEMKVSELPKVWDDMYEKYLGIRPTKQSEGCLQDIHWYMGAFGYFPFYTVGAIIASMLAKKLREIFLDFDQRLSKGDLNEIMDWLKTNIHSKASTLPLKDLLISATGSDLDYECYLDYLKNKFIDPEFEVLPSGSVEEATIAS